MLSIKNKIKKSHMQYDLNFKKYAWYKRNLDYFK